MKGLLKVPSEAGARVVGRVAINVGKGQWSAELEASGGVPLLGHGDPLQLVLEDGRVGTVVITQAFFNGDVHRYMLAGSGAPPVKPTA